MFVERCKLTQREAEAVLEMRLWSLTRKVVKDLEDEMREAVVPSPT